MSRREQRGSSKPARTSTRFRPGRRGALGSRSRAGVPATTRSIESGPTGPISSAWRNRLATMRIHRSLRMGSGSRLRLHVRASKTKPFSSFFRRRSALRGDCGHACRRFGCSHSHGQLDRGRCAVLGPGSPAV